MPPLTKAQRAVVTHGSGHLLVDAGAGSGKTTTVVQLICHRLGVAVAADGEPITPVRDPLSFEKIAAITFTNQAAADLKRKLRAALRAAGRRDLAAEVDAARIGTIHGFCGDLLRDHALRARSRPGRRILEEGEGAALADECAAEALQSAIEAGDVPELASLLSGRKLSDLVLMVARLSEDSDRVRRLVEHRPSLRGWEQALLMIAERALTLRETQLERDGLLDFDRMIVAVRALLSDASVRAAVQRRLRLLVLDEFQDVDPVQRDIALLLGGLSARDAEPTQLVLVGDPKQSIYRFRRADVTIWNAMRLRFERGEGTVLPLHENFRSKAAILAMVDATIGTQLGDASKPETLQPYEVAYAPLIPAAAEKDGDHAVEFLVVPPAPSKRSIGDLRDIEAATVAQRMVELNSDGTAYGDMAILLAGWGDVGRYAGALKDAGIPYYLLRSEGFWEAREVLDVVLALRAIRDRADNIAIAGFLKSPFVGLRDETLLALARAAEGAPLASALGVVTHERPLLDRAMALLDDFGALRDRVSIHVLLDRLLRASGYLAYVASHPLLGAQSVANLRKLLRVAAANPDQSLGDFLRMIADQRERGDRVAPERLYRERADVVTITSIHSSKGLEWPVVFWCDLSRAAKSDNDRLLFGRDTFALKQANLPDKQKDPVHVALADEIGKEQRAESYRLWYVAATRARRHLVLSGIPLEKPDKGAPAHLFVQTFSALESANEITYKGESGIEYHASVRYCLPDRFLADAVEAALPSLALPPARHDVPMGARRLSATQLMQFAKSPAEWWTRYVDRLDEPRAPLAGGGGSTVTQGLIVHDVLERLGSDPRELDELLEAAIAARDEDAPDAESVEGWAYRRWLRERIDAAVSSDAWQSHAGGANARRELAFTRLLADGTVIAGAMDLATRDGNAAHILDVKTSTVAARHLAERYVVQGAVYRDAAQAIAGADEATFTLLALPSGETVPVTGGEALNEIVQRLRSWRPR